MIPIRDLTGQHRGIVMELARYDYASVAPIMAGFLTLPDYHANTLRLDALAHLACYACEGKRQADRELLIKCAGRHFIGSQLVLMEDPVEDAFIGKVATTFGNFRVFRGIEESGDFWLESLLRPLEEPNVPEPLLPLIQHARALLALTDAVAARLGLERYTYGSGRLRARLQIPQWRELMSAARAVTFSYSDLQQLGVASETLAPFILTEESRGSLINQTTGHSDFHRFPICRFGELIVLTAPHAVTATIRRFIIEELQKTGFFGFFDVILHTRQIEVWLDTLRHDFHCTPLRVDLPDPPTEIPTLYQAAMSFDAGKYGHVIMVDGNLQGHLANAHDVDRLTQAQQDAFEKHLISCSEVLKSRPDFSGGMTIITRGGVGRGIFMGFRELPKDWEFIFASLPDWYTLAGCEDMSALRTWRMCRQKAWAEKHGLRIHNLNGPLNLYAFWRAHGWRFLLQDMPLANPHKTLAMEIDFLTAVRKKVEQDRDEHSCLSHNGAGWIRVRRRYPKAYRDKDRRAPMYVAVDEVSKGRLLASVETPARIWWIATQIQATEGEGKRVGLELWDCLLNWIARGAAIFDREFAQLPPGSIWIEIVFPDLENWSDYAADQLAASPSAWPNTTTSRSERKISLSIPSGFKNEFHVPDNRAERTLLKHVIRGLSDLESTLLPETTIIRLLDAIFPNTEARFFHVLRTENVVQMIGQTGKASPDFIPEEDLSQSLIGLAEEVGNIPAGAKVQGQTECLGYLQTVADALWQRIEQQLRPYDRTAVVQSCFSALAELERDAEHWSMTSRALLALEENGGEILQEAADRRAKRDAASLTNRLLAETAMYAAMESGGKLLPEAERLELMAHMRNLVLVANHRDAISGGFMPPAVYIHPNGELEVDEKFYESVMQPYTSAVFQKGFRSAARSYERWFSDYERPDSPYVEEVLKRLEQPFVDEFGITLDQFVAISMQLRRLALEQQRLFLEFDEPSFMSFLEHLCGLDVKSAHVYLERFSLPPRRAWNKDLPANCAENDVWPWRFRRQLSFLMRPFALLSNKGGKKWLVYVPLVERSKAYVLNGISQAAFPTEIFQSEAMRQFCGDQANRQGKMFTHDTADTLEEIGFKSRREVPMSALGVPGSLGDYGDVDVLAWKADSSPVLVIECKHLRTATSVRDVVDRLEEYRGQRDDALSKHLRRLDWLQKNPSAVSSLTTIPQAALKLKGLLVTDDVVPMQFFEGSSVPPGDVVSFEQLKDVLK